MAFYRVKTSALSAAVCAISVSHAVASDDADPFSDLPESDPLPFFQSTPYESAHVENMASAYLVFAEGEIDQYREEYQFKKLILASEWKGLVAGALGSMKPERAERCLSDLPIGAIAFQAAQITADGGEASSPIHHAIMGVTTICMLNK